MDEMYRCHFRLESRVPPLMYFNARNTLTRAMIG